jgi:prohibitin 1
MSKGMMVLVVLMILALFTLIISFGIVNVSPTEVGVQVNKLAGTVSPEPLGVGYHFYNRWKTDVVVYQVAARSYPPDTEKSEQSDEYNLDLKTKDGQNINLDLTIIYSLFAKEVPNLHQQIGSNYETEILLPQIRSEARIVVGSYSAEEIYQGKVRQEIQVCIAKELGLAVQKYPAIQIQDALIRDFSFSREFEKAIEEKKLAAQRVEINKNLAAAQEQEALKQEAEARGKKLMAIQEAEGIAESNKIKADAERYKLEQEAAGKLAGYKADAEGKKLQAEALGGGENVVALMFAEKIPPTLQIWGVPVGQNNTSLMDLSGVFKNMFQAAPAAVPGK